MMTLAKLIEVLRLAPNIGHPAVFETPDGKQWVPMSVVQTTEVNDEGTYKASTVIKLKQESKK